MGTQYARSCTAAALAEAPHMLPAKIAMPIQNAPRSAHPEFRERKTVASHQVCNGDKKHANIALTEQSRSRTN